MYMYYYMYVLHILNGSLKSYSCTGKSYSCTGSNLLDRITIILVLCKQETTREFAQRNADTDILQSTCTYLVSRARVYCACIFACIGVDFMSPVHMFLVHKGGD